MRLLRGKPGKYNASTSTGVHPAISKCDISCLPPEILAHIFVIGSEIINVGPGNQWERRYSNLDGNEEELEVHFATLCSHVCQYWRTVVINIGELWSCLSVDESSCLNQLETWIDRAKDVPLVILVDYSVDDPPNGEDNNRHLLEEELKAHAILDLILPHVHHWKGLELTTNSYNIVWHWQTKLLHLLSAPILEYMGLFCHGDWFEDVFQPCVYRGPMVLFPQGIPKLRFLVLWGVHFDWESTSFLRELEHLELAWHAKDIRPTTKDFAQALIRSPNLNSLCLEGSAPLQGTWPQERCLLPKLLNLRILQVDVSDAISVIDHIDFPALTNLDLDLEVDDVKHFILAVCQPNRPRFGSLESIMLVSFQCLKADGVLFLSTLYNVKSMFLNFNYLPIHFLHALASHSPCLCPRLETLRLSGINSRGLKALIKARKRSPTPIRRLFLDVDDEFSDRTLQWLKKEVEIVDHFENSDVEDDSSDGGDDGDSSDSSEDSGDDGEDSGNDGEDSGGDGEDSGDDDSGYDDE